MDLKQKNLDLNNELLRIFLIIIIFVLAMLYRFGYGYADDAAFFLRYAENFTDGQFWVWNLGDQPIWGASSPLFPLAIAVPLLFNVDPLNAVLFVSLFFGVSSFLLLSNVFFKKLGSLIAFLFILFSISDSHLMWYAGSAGLEIPLTLFLFSVFFYVIFNKERLDEAKLIFNISFYQLLLGVILSLIAVQKLDLIPFAFIALFILSVLDKKIYFKALIIFLVASISWYFFAYIYFGHPVPNSFLTKAFLQDQPKVIDWTWFYKFTLIDNRNFLFIPFIFFPLFIKQKNNILFFKVYYISVLFVLCHLVAYSIKYPFEPYTWYAMPSFFFIKIILSLGASVAIIFIQKFNIFFRLFFISLFLILFISFINAQGKLVKSIKHYLKFEEDRVKAGQWVDDNTPKDFTVFTYWGNPAYFSRRYVYDGSFLNMKFEKNDVISKYRPDVLILDPGYRPGYTLVKIINDAKQIGIDYPYGIHILDEQLNKVINIDESLKNCFKKNTCVNLNEPLINYSKKISDEDIHSTLSATKSKDTIFIHPGKNLPTVVEIDFNNYLSKFKSLDSEQNISIHGYISEKINLSSVERGGGNVLVTIYQNDKIILNKKQVDIKDSFNLTIPVSSIYNYKIEVDSNDNADSDWFNLSVILN